MSGEFVCFAGQDDEDGLGDFFGLMRIAGMAQGDGVNPVDVPRDKRLKRRFGMAGGIFAQQSIVVQLAHLPLNAANPEKVTVIVIGRAGGIQIFTEGNEGNGDLCLLL